MRRNGEKFSWDLKILKIPQDDEILRGFSPINVNAAPVSLSVENIGVFWGNFDVKIDFYVQEDFKNAMGNNANNSSEDRKKISQKWPKFHHFWNCGHTMPKHETKIHMDHILATKNMCVELQNFFGMAYFKNTQNGKNSQNGHKMDTFHSKNGSPIC